jgi:hypothetical protein
MNEGHKAPGAQEAPREARQMKRRSMAGPRDCCLVSPETAHQHGHEDARWHPRPGGHDRGGGAQGASSRSSGSVRPVGVDGTSPTRRAPRRR